jgi:hypothetical protein
VVPPLPIPATVTETSERGGGSDSSSPSRSPSPGKKQQTRSLVDDETAVVEQNAGAAAERRCVRTPSQREEKVANRNGEGFRLGDLTRPFRDARRLPSPGL